MASLGQPLPSVQMMTSSRRRRHARLTTTRSLFVPLMATVILAVSFASLALHHLHSYEHSNPVRQALVRYAHQSNRVASSVSYPVEDPIPNPDPSTIDGNSTFSACMLVMDDNHRLQEWLAYHYHVLPLRYMIVAVDPRSKTSPTSIFNVWRRQGVYIEEWTDRDFWRKGINKTARLLNLKPIPEDAGLQVKRDRHRGRQKYFYRSCLIQMKEAKRTWIALHDSDEYLVYNHAGGDKFVEWQEKMQQRFHGATRMQPAMIPPTTAEEGAMIRYIRHEQAAGLEYYQSPCIGIPRLTFGATPSSLSNVQQEVPASFRQDAHRFDTLNWRKHARRNDFVKNALGKVLLDVSRIDVASTPQFQSLHRPIKAICSAPWHNECESGLRINHYLGSWESYSFRDDSRRGNERSREQWEYKKNIADGTDDNIRPWLGGFVETLGEQKAHELLDNKVGLPDGYRNTNTSAWSILPDRLEKILSTNETIANDNKMIAFDSWVREKYKELKSGK